VTGENGIMQSFLVATPQKILFGRNTIRESKMGGQCGTYGREGKCREFGGGT